MDIQTVYQLFAATYHPDPKCPLKEVESNPTILSLFLQIIGSEESELPVRQAVTIYFKNRVRKAWTLSAEQNGISPGDKDNVKNNILRVLVPAPPMIRVQLTACLGTILSQEFPDNWAGYLPQVQELLNSNDHRAVYGGLTALHEVVKIYQWKSQDKRGPLLDIIKHAFPTLQTIAASLAASESLEAAEMLKTILKTYYCSIQYDLSEAQQQNDSLIQWGSLFLQLVEKAVPNQPADVEDREKYIWWKAKKWAYHCLNRLFSRYGNPALLPATATKYSNFAKNFIQHFAPNILNTYLAQTEAYISGKAWLSKKIIYLLAMFYSDCIKHKSTWQIFKPHMESIVAHFIFPELCYKEEDQALWAEDPVEFVHKKVDPLEDFRSPVTACMNLLIDLVRDRKKHTFMGILGFANTVLNKYAENPTDPNLARQKDGALCMIGCLSHTILRKKSGLESQMESFFVTHVFPEFRGSYPFLRARACDIMNKFSDLDFQNQDNVAIAFQSLLDCLRDSELPVKVYAALAIQPMIRHELVREAIVPHVPQIMNEFLSLTNQIDIDTLANVMEEFVEVFAEQLAPFANQLCEQMRDTFLRIMEEVTQNTSQIDIDNGAIDMDDMGDKTMAAMGVLKTIGTLILSLESTPELLAQLEQTLMPVIRYTLEKQIIDLYDEIFEIIDCCTFSSKTVSPTMWGVFDLIYHSFKDSGIDFMEEMLPSLDNFISYGKEVFMSNPDAQHKVFDIIDTVMKSDRVGENDRVCACKLAESLLLNCRGGVDAFIPPLLGLACTYLFNENAIQTSALLVHCLEVVVNCIYYNPALTLRTLEEQGLTTRFFTLWFQNLEKFSRVHDKKLTIVALCALIELPNDQIPASLQPVWSQLMEGVLNVFRSLPKAIENRKRMEKLYGEGMDDEDDMFARMDGDLEDFDDELEIEDECEDGDVVGEDKEYLDYLSQQAAAHLPDDDFEDEEELEEEVLFESPLDSVDVYISFQDTIQKLQQVNPASYQVLTQSISPDNQSLIMSVFTTADANRSKSS
ncbi:ARM repeat-containing protein [Basidiobolus meristosporus CBS 931.73]|uniref:ARM repeat-containing protein n=1 Tax=Basidiobolus meristosporus CBS 931.73 TaxID=1314790 RepID=A0A1Y1X1K9_9FUNG|nr:ARM repeat-containing protein [Basidiobolus meristosporus CBS 931.73]|eukprot:ORX79697.1 ARM repeat-containing protein [Basidiobolus meristosporus CBS 931.73]